MACPHVAGVAAQLVEKTPAATPQSLLNAMECDAAQEMMNFQVHDTVNKNLLLQTPKDDGRYVPVHVQLITHYSIYFTCQVLYICIIASRMLKFLL